MVALGSDEDLIRSIFMVGGCEPDGESNLVEIQDFRSRADLILDVGRVIQEISSTEETLFNIDDRYEDGARLNPTRLGRRFLKVLRRDRFQAFEDYPDYKFNPYFEVFYAEIEAAGLISCGHLINNELCIGSVNTGNIAEFLNGFIKSIRGKLKSKEFNDKLKSYRRSVRENYKGLTSYVNGLFDLHSRMLVVRLDLSYQKEFRSADEISFRDAAKHRRTLLDYLDKGGFGEFLGYSWKFEKGRRKGLHNHMLFFFNGAKVCKDVVISKMIGEYWKNVVTGGKGAYFNCNAFKGRYKYCGVGMVHHSDADAREGLRIIAAYMTKLDEYFKLSVRGVRSFGKGVLPKPSAVKQGRPRTKISFS